jgi:hypothetical protein
LEDPFEEEDTEEEISLLWDDKEEVLAIIAGDKLTSLQDAMQSQDWLMWNIELKLLKEMGTWEMVQKPPEAKALPNKWTFIKKCNKEGNIVRH